MHVRDTVFYVGITHVHVVSECVPDPVVSCISYAVLTVYLGNESLPQQTNLWPPQIQVPPFQWVLAVRVSEPV